MKLTHYTSIDSLKKILKNQTIKFTRLDHLDDYYEISPYASQDLVKMLFVSCWSHPESESIPQWAMYGDNNCGVSITLDSEFINITPKPIIIENKYSIVPSLLDPRPREIQYFNKHDLFEKIKGVVKVNCAGGVNTYGDIAIFKLETWSFQKEYRIVLNVSQSPEYFDANLPAAQQVVPDLDCVYVGFKPDFLNNIEITLGPFCTEQQENEVKDLLVYCGVHNKLKRSGLTEVLKQKSANEGRCVTI